MTRNYLIHKTASPALWLIFLMLIWPTLWLMLMNKTIIMEWALFIHSLSPIYFTFLLDPYGMMFSSAVILISANVLSFSKMYMSEDKFIDRFTIMVLLFVLSMNMLIYLPHFMMLLLGWDGLGITSFILVVYYQNAKSLAAGMITALTNRIGDVMLLLSIAWTVNQGHWNILHMFQSEFSSMQIACITLAAMTKSAQMPFSSWLPAAMAAPTPVSALVHSSTLVTAGVFLLFRFYPFLHSFQMFNTVVLFTATSTMLMAGLSAVTECDMKKIIALSTLSQLGMMMAGLGLGMPYLTYFHMVTHAMFKALLFICAGGLINCHMHSQDLRWMGNITNQMPVSTSCIITANLALCGFPFMAGFYSKDLILEAALHNNYNLFMLCLIFISVGLTSFYSLRFVIITCWSSAKSVPFKSITEPQIFSTPMLVLATASIMSGSLILWASPIKQMSLLMSTTMKSLPLLMTILGIVIAWMLITLPKTKTCVLQSLHLSHNASCMMWFMAPLSSQFMMKLPFTTCLNTFKTIDQSWLEIVGPQGVNKNIMNNSSNWYKLYPATPSSYLSTSLLMFMIIVTVTLIS